MDFFNKSDDELKTSILRLLVKMSRVDGEVTGKELLYLLDIGNVYGYNPEKVRSFLYEEEQKISIPIEEKDRMTILYVLLFLMKIDGKISTPEENMIFHYGFKLGFNESLIREMIIVIKQHLGKKLPPDELLKQVKKYLN